MHIVIHTYPIAITLGIISIALLIIAFILPAPSGGGPAPGADGK